MKTIDPELYRKIQVAHDAVREAQNYAYMVKTPFLVQIRLNKVQSILIHYLVKYAK